MHAILLYGATGYSGRLIAARAHEQWANGRRGRRLIVAGRSGPALRDLANALDVEYRVFELATPREIDAGLQDVAVIINAAGPFALTGEALAKGALRSGCHYVDINGEVDVYKRLDDLGYFAEQRGLTLVSGAGHSAAASDLLLEGALQRLSASVWPDGAPRELGAVRVGLSRVLGPSRGSLLTSLRAVREQVLIVRDSAEPVSMSSSVRTARHLVLTYVPFGQLERFFDFGAPEDARASLRSMRIASAVNLVDTLTARLTTARHVDRVLRIESYLETPEVLRGMQQWAAVTAPFWTLPGVRDLARQQIELLPDGPTPEERAREQLSVVLEIEDLVGQPLLNWRIHTPSAYDFTACAAVAVAERLPPPPARTGTSSAARLAGWRTPGEFLVEGGAMIDPCTGTPLHPLRNPAHAAGVEAASRNGCTVYASVGPTAVA